MNVFNLAEVAIRSRIKRDVAEDNELPGQKGHTATDTIIELEVSYQTLGLCKQTYMGH